MPPPRLRFEPFSLSERTRLFPQWSGVCALRCHFDTSTPIFVALRSVPVLDVVPTQVRYVALRGGGGKKIGNAGLGKKTEKEERFIFPTARLDLGRFAKGHQSRCSLASCPGALNVYPQEVRPALASKITRKRSVFPGVQKRGDHK